MIGTAYFRADVGEPGRSGLHGDWLWVARAIAEGCVDELGVALHLNWTLGRASRAVEGMLNSYLIWRVGGDLILLRKGAKRLKQAEDNGR